jgi:glutamine cyclotransferase
MATIQNLTIDQDADFTQTLTVKDSTGTVVDISGQTVTSKIRKTHLSSTATSFTTAIVSGTAGTCSITLTDTVTAALTEGRYVWDLTTTTSGGLITRRIEGRATVTPSVTR